MLFCKHNSASDRPSPIEGKPYFVTRPYPDLAYICVGPTRKNCIVNIRKTTKCASSPCTSSPATPVNIPASAVWTANRHPKKTLKGRCVADETLPPPPLPTPGSEKKSKHSFCTSLVFS